MNLKQTTFDRIQSAWDRFFFDPADARPYSFFRILYAALLLIHNAAMYPSIEFYYSEHGILPFAVSRSVIGPMTWSIFAWLPKSDVALWTVYWVFTAAAVCLMLGLFSRVASIICYVCLISFHHRNNLITDGEDTVLRIYGLLLIFMPHGQFVSMDRIVGILRGKQSIDPADRQTAPCALRILQLYMCFMFLSACIWKLRGREWLEGTALYYVSRLDDFFGRFPVPSFPFEYLPMTKAMTWSVLWVEGCVPFLIWFEETRLVALLAAISFDLGCDYMMNLFLFHWVMILGWLCFLSDAEMRKIGSLGASLLRKVGLRPVAIAYDGTSDFCQRLVAVLRECDIFSFLTFEIVRQGKKGWSEGYFSVRTAKGAELIGFTAVRYALRSVPISWPFLPLFYAPGFSLLGRLLPLAAGSSPSLRKVG